MCYTAFIFHPRWKEQGTEATISWDVSGYYMYLPALFIYKDIKECKFKDSILNKYGPTPNFQQAFLHEASGNYVMKYTAGQAIIMSPFFAVGHLWATVSSEYLADGFSYPYQISLGMGMFLIGFLGLFYLRKILILYFKDSTVAILLLLYVAGTNYLNYSSVDQCMTHNTLFTIYALLLWTTIQFYKKKKKSQVVITGLLTGLATLIRPTEIVSILIPLFWGVQNKNEILLRFQFLKDNYLKLLIAALLFGFIVLIQAFYWHYATGDWIVYSYQDQGFSWLKPHVWDYSMSYRSGWLRYCPMLFLPLLGLFFYTKNGPSKWLVIFYAILTFYITTAWDVWDYGGPAGRAMVQHYVVLAFPFAFLIEKINQKKALKYIFYSIVFLFIYLNIWSFTGGNGTVQIIGASRQYYWATVGRWDVDKDTKKLLDNRYHFKGIPKNPEIIYTNPLQNDSIDYVFVNKEKQYTDKFEFDNPAKKKASQNYKWLRTSTEFHCIYKEWDLWKQCQYVLIFYKNDKEIQSNQIRVHRFITNGETKELYLDAKTPVEWDKASIHYWNAGSDQELRMRNLKVIGFND